MGVASGAQGDTMHHEEDWIEELAAQAGVAPGDARAVLEVLKGMNRERSGRPLPVEAVDPGPNDAWRLPARRTPPSYQPSSSEVVRLIEEAERHPLGIEFLLEGELGAVAATFGVHAFTVDAARRRLGAARD